MFCFVFTTTNICICVNCALCNFFNKTKYFFNKTLTYYIVELTCHESNHEITIPITSNKIMVSTDLSQIEATSSTHKFQNAMFSDKS